MEIEASLVKRFRRHVRSLSLEHLVSVVEGDLQLVDLSSATIIVLYLLPESVLLITPILKAALRRGARLVCNTWGPKAFTPAGRASCGLSNNVTLLYYDQSSLPLISE